jgi:hypothetical protein
MTTYKNSELGRAPSEDLVRNLHEIVAALHANLALGEYQRIYGADATRKIASQGWAKAHAAWAQATNHDASITLTLPLAYSRYSAVAA